MPLGSKLLTAGAAAYTTDGLKVLYRPDGGLEVGGALTYDPGKLSSPTAIIEIKGKLVTVFSVTKEPGQYGSPLINGVIIITGYPAVSINSDLFSLGSDKILYRGTKSIASLPWAPATRIHSGIGSESTFLQDSDGIKEFNEQQSPSRKKSGVTRHSYTILAFSSGNSHCMHGFSWLTRAIHVGLEFLNNIATEFGKPSAFNA